MWLLSYPSHREHWRETGFLATEAAINSLVAVEALKYTRGESGPFKVMAADRFLAEEHRFHQSMQRRRGRWRE